MDVAGLILGIAGVLLSVAGLFFAGVQIREGREQLSRTVTNDEASRKMLIAASRDAQARWILILCNQFDSAESELAYAVQSDNIFAAERVMARLSTLASQLAGLAESDGGTLLANDIVRLKDFASMAGLAKNELVSGARGKSLRAIARDTLNAARELTVTTQALVARVNMELKP